MPELPEIETLSLELKSALEGRQIQAVVIRNEAILETPRNGMERTLPGKRILEVGRIGKYLRIQLSEGFTLWFHLGMTGQLLDSLDSESLSHVHFILSFAGSSRPLLYRDVRRFGRIALTPYRGATCPAGVRGLGPEPTAWEEEAFVSFFKERRGRIKNLLLNQKLIAGLGNIYADESLHRAGIHPRRRAFQVSRERLSRLHQALREVLEEAVQHGGSSIDDYLHWDGTRGEFQSFHRVYGRGGQHCRTCGELIRKVKLSGRTSSFCPQCQP